MSDRVSIAIEGGVADVRLNRPDKLNAVDAAMFSGLVEAGESLKADPSVRAWCCRARAGGSAPVSTSPASRPWAPASSGVRLGDIGPPGRRSHHERRPAGRLRVDRDGRRP